MKKGIMFFAALAFVVSMSSCKKDWTCTCTTAGIEASTTFNATKKDAEAACDNLNTSVGGVTTSCSLD